MTKKTKKRKWYVYILIDPDDPEPRYVGWTFNTTNRLAQHISGKDKPHTHKARWIAKIIRDGRRPSLIVIVSGIGDGWANAERQWIAAFRRAGCCLTNATDGGDGVPGHRHSQKSKSKMAAAKLGRKASEETRRRMSESNKGKHRLSDDDKERLSTARRCRVISDEERLRMAETARINFGKPEVWKKRADTIRGRKCSKETKAKIRARHVGKKLSEEHRRKLSVARKGKSHTPEALAAIRAGIAAYNASLTPERRKELIVARSKGRWSS